MSYLRRMAFGVVLSVLGIGSVHAVPISLLRTDLGSNSSQTVSIGFDTDDTCCFIRAESRAKGGTSVGIVEVEGADVTIPLPFAEATAKVSAGKINSGGTGPTTGNAYASASAEYDYYFTLIPEAGFDYSAPIPVMFDVVAYTMLSYVGDSGYTTSGYSGSVNGINLFQQDGINFSSSVSQGNLYISTSKASGRTTIDLYSGTINRIQLSAFASAKYSLYSQGALTSKAYADPIITIDPTWEFADMFSIEFDYPTNFSGSLSVSNDPTSVPEPHSVALLGLGLVGLSIARRKKAA